MKTHRLRTEIRPSAMRLENRTLPLAVILCGVLLSVVWVQAQGRGGGEWTTGGSDAQRTAWVRTDARLTKDAVTKGEFQFLWKHRFDNEARQLNSLTQPVLLDRLIGFRGFKALAFVGGSADRIFAIDTDLARPYWTTHLNYTATTGGPPPSSWACPGGLVATPTRRTVLAPSAFAGGGGGGRGGRSGSAVGEPGRGAAVLAQMAAAAGARPRDCRAAARAAGRSGKRRHSGDSVRRRRSRVRRRQRRLSAHAALEQRRRLGAANAIPAAQLEALRADLRRRRRLREHVRQLRRRARMPCGRSI